MCKLLVDSGLTAIDKLKRCGYWVYPSVGVVGVVCDYPKCYWVIRDDGIYVRGVVGYHRYYGDSGGMLLIGVGGGE